MIRFDTGVHVPPNQAHLFLPHPVDGETEGFPERSNIATQAKMILAVPYSLLQLEVLQIRILKEKLQGTQQYIQYACFSIIKLEHQEIVKCNCYNGLKECRLAMIKAVSIPQ
jgi:hypothetical protein